MTTPGLTSGSLTSEADTRWTELHRPAMIIILSGPNIMFTLYVSVVHVYSALMKSYQYLNFDILENI